MTKKELIDALAEYPDDKEVCVYDSHILRSIIEVDLDRVDDCIALWDSSNLSPKASRWLVGNSD